MERTNREKPEGEGFPFQFFLWPRRGGEGDSGKKARRVSCKLKFRARFFYMKRSIFSPKKRPPGKSPEKKRRIFAREKFYVNSALAAGGGKAVHNSRRLKKTAKISLRRPEKGMWKTLWKV